MLYSRPPKVDCHRTVDGGLSYLGSERFRAGRLNPHDFALQVRPLKAAFDFTAFTITYNDYFGTYVCRYL